MPEWCESCGHFYFAGEIQHKANCGLLKRRRWDTMTLVEKADYVHADMRKDAYYVYLHELLKAMAKKIEGGDGKMIREIDSINAQTNETLRLHYAVAQFSTAMFAKLREKEYEGYEGWGEENIPSFIEGLKEHVEKPLTMENVVDIANFCMMLWCQGGGEVR